MTTFNLSHIEKINDKIDKYIYRNKENGNCVIFHLHPTKSFTFVLDFASRDLTQKLIDKLFNKFFENAIDRDKYKGGFDEAIQTLIF